MSLDINLFIKKLWMICIGSSISLTAIYTIWVGSFDIIYYQLLSIMLLGYLPFTLIYRKFSPMIQRYLLFINMCVVIVALTWFTPFANQIAVIFLPLFATLFKNRNVFYGTSVASILIHFSLNSMAGYYDQRFLFEIVTELSYIICYIVVLGVFVNMIVDSSKQAYMFDKTVKTLILAIETKDMYTRGHSIRVSDYAMIIGSNMKKKGYKVDLDLLRISSLIHDIGKVYIPNDILTKNGKLTLEEYKTIQKHSEFGANLAKELEYPNEIVSDILYHHERYDGKGYPRGISQDDIPLHSRIIALADTFDAITTTRSYRNAFTLEEAKDIIIEAMNTQFDPILHEVFLEIYPSLVTYYHQNVSLEAKNEISYLEVMNKR
ncbi:HD-GYP domain-containing protein [Anaerobacillus alkaliphilus]|uniref:HD-GYP domain-containing protein n=1 Tax=Anaerobacillus alkaliphilus TaxID=1548597 RepID=A0A4Q0VP68_9BACI|nr:HD-GYP domain-containing protein [Anaerobacillus alkaliphilus]RXI97919.1 HD-GYP domain-containing protein [Anaerobacillus alkaliphilus]